MYRLQQNSPTVIRTSDGAFVPEDNGEYQKWLAEGNTPAAADLPDYAALLKTSCKAKLDACDWTQTADRAAQLTAEQRTAWATYRQALMDLPAGTADPANPVWPVEPGKGG